MLGIIVLQLFWMKNALQVRNELFDQSVKEALLETSKRMETMADVFIIQHMAGPGRQNLSHSMPPRMYQFKIQHQTLPLDTIRAMRNRNVSNRKSRERTVKVISKANKSNQEKNIEIEVVELDSVIVDLEKTIDRNFSYWIDSTAQIIQNDSSLINQQNDFRFKFNNRAERLKRVAGQMVYENWMIDKFRIPDTAIIKSTLAEELSMRNIPIEFEFGVLSPQNTLIKTDRADSVLLIKTGYSTRLFPNEIISSGEQLKLYFPGRKAYVLKALIGPALLSIFFCVLILVVFGLSIYYIMNQKKISEMKSDFINNMTHEFKTPIATISVASDTIVNPKIITDADQVRHFTQIIKKENLRMNQQVESILQIARLEKKEFDFKFVVVNIHELIDLAIQIIGLQVEIRGGSIETNLSAQNPLITTDSKHALNLLNNLLDNANKYSTGKPEILVSTKNSEKGVWVTVSDKGIGMSRQVQQKIFEKFYRETSGNIHNVKGFGLGLSYVKAVVEANNGEIKVTSEPGAGSTFKVFFPFTISKTEKTEKTD